MVVTTGQRVEVELLLLEGRTTEKISELVGVSCEEVDGIRRSHFKRLPKRGRIEYKRVKLYVCQVCKRAGVNPYTYLDPCPVCAIKESRDDTRET